MSFINPFASSTKTLEEALAAPRTPVTREMVENYMKLLGAPPAGLGLGHENEVVRVTNTIMRSTGTLATVDGTAVQTSFDEDRAMASILAYKTNPSQFPTAFQWLHDLCLLVGLQRRVVSMGRATPSSLVSAQHIFAADVLRCMHIVTNPHDLKIVNLATTTSGTHCVDIQAAHAANQNQWTGVPERFAAIMSSSQDPPKTTQFASGDSITMGPVTCSSILTRMKDVVEDMAPFSRGVNLPNVNNRQRRAANTVVMRGASPAAWTPGEDAELENKKAARRRVHIVTRPTAVAPIMQASVGHDAARDLVGAPIVIPKTSDEALQHIWAGKVDDESKKPHTYFREIAIITKTTGTVHQVRSSVVPRGVRRPDPLSARGTAKATKSTKTTKSIKAKPKAKPTPKAKKRASVNSSVRTTVPSKRARMLVAESSDDE